MFWGCFGFIDLLCVVVAVAAQWREQKHQDKWKEWEHALKKYSLIVLPLSSGLSMLSIAPFLRYRTAETARIAAVNELKKESPFKAQLRGEARDLANSIHMALTNGQSAEALGRNFGLQVNTLIPKFSNAGLWSPELQRAFNETESDYHLTVWTNLERVLRETAHKN